MKRGQQVKIAISLVAEGIEFSPSELPRSMQTQDDAPEPVQKLAAAEPTAARDADQPEAQSATPAATPERTDIREYLLSRKRKAS